MGKWRSRVNFLDRDTSRTLRGKNQMSTQLDRIATKAKQNPKIRFTSLIHIINPEFLRETWFEMNRKGSPGIDGKNCGGIW